MNKPFIIFTLILIFLSTPISALQQTVGEISINNTVGNTSHAKYGIRNEENQSITVKFNVTGNVSKYLEYPQEMVLETNQFVYVEINSSIPSNYSGEKELNGTIYVLKEGEKGGQVQLNIRLGKNIRLNIEGQEVIKDDKTTKKIISITLISISIIVVIAMIYKKPKRKEAKYIWKNIEKNQ